MKMEEKISKTEAQITKQDLYISRAQFREYCNVQNTGIFNMLDPRARRLTNLNKEEWVYIIKHYDYLYNLYQ